MTYLLSVDVYACVLLCVDAYVYQSMCVFIVVSGYSGVMLLCFCGDSDFVFAGQVIYGSYIYVCVSKCLHIG